MGPRIVVRRYAYEEPLYLHLDVSVSNGAFAARVDLYCNREDLETVGAALAAFPRSVPDEFRWEYGSEDPSDRYYRYFLLRAFTFDKLHCALHFQVNKNEDPPEDGVARCSIVAEPAAINRLGRLFLAFYELRHAAFEWDEHGDELFEHWREVP